MKTRFIKHPIIYGSIIACIIFLVYAIIMYFIFHDASFPNNSRGTEAIQIEQTTTHWITAGTFGDMFGCLSALFTSLAFIGMLYTIYLQNKTLASINKNERDNKALVEQHWYFSHIDRINSKWMKERQADSMDINEATKFIRNCITSGTDKESFKKLVKFVSSAKNARAAYTIIMYTVERSMFFTETEQHDCITMTFRMLEQDLQFCIGVLLMQSRFPHSMKFIQEFVSPNNMCSRYCKYANLTGYEADMRKLVFKLIQSRLLEE